MTAIKALDPAFTAPANPTTYYSGTQSGNANATPPYVCVADGATLNGVVTGGEYRDSENGLNTVI